MRGTLYRVRVGEVFVSLGKTGSKGSGLTKDSRGKVRRKRFVSHRTIGKLGMDSQFMTALYIRTSRSMRISIRTRSQRYFLVVPSNPDLEFAGKV